jgi:hypothetical protein
MDKPLDHIYNKNGIATVEEGNAEEIYLAMNLNEIYCTIPC